MTVDSELRSADRFHSEHEAFLRMRMFAGLLFVLLFFSVVANVAMVRSLRTQLGGNLEQVAPALSERAK